MPRKTPTPRKAVLLRLDTGLAARLYALAGLSNESVNLTASGLLDEGIQRVSDQLNKAGVSTGHLGLGNPLLGVAADEPGPVGGGQRA